MNGKFVIASENGITIAGAAADKLIASGDAQAALLYIYILKKQGNFEWEEACLDLGFTAEAFSRSADALTKMGLLAKVEEDIEIAEKIEEAKKESKYQRLVREKASMGEMFNVLTDEVQRKLRKILSFSELSELQIMYGRLQMPAGVLALLVTYCIEDWQRKHGEDRYPTMQYISAVGHSWAKSGIYTEELAENHIKKMHKKQSTAEQMCKVLQITGRAPSKTENNYIESWIEMGFEADAVELAYDRTVVKTGKLTWKYLNAIMKNWHKARVYTADAIKKHEDRREKKEEKSGNYELEAIEWMKEYQKNKDEREGKS